MPYPAPVPIHMVATALTLPQFECVHIYFASVGLNTMAHFSNFLGAPCKIQIEVAMVQSQTQPATFRKYEFHARYNILNLLFIPL